MRLTAQLARPPLDPLRRPIFIVCPPGSGTEVLVEALAPSPGLVTIGGVSHGLIEGLAGLHPADHGWASNQLTALDATPSVVRQLRHRFTEAMRGHDGSAPAPVVTLLEKTPKNALRIPFLAAAFPQARFVHLHRDPIDALAGTLEDWRSGRFTTYAKLPGWDGPPWSFLLVPGWEDLRGLPLPEVVAHQWSRTVEVMLDDLTALPSDRWCIASHGRLVEDPVLEAERLRRVLDLPWEPGTLPQASMATSPSMPRRLDPELGPALRIVADAADRALQLFAGSSVVGY